MQVDLDHVNEDNHDALGQAIDWLVSEFVRRQNDRSFGKLSVEFFWENGIAVTANLDARDQIRGKVKRDFRRT